MAEREWTPTYQVIQRIAGRVLRADNMGLLSLGWAERAACVDCLTQRSVSYSGRRRVSRLWLLHGASLAAQSDDPVDVLLDEVVRSGGGSSEHPDLSG